MAFSNGVAGGFGRGRSRSLGALSEINIVPLVDVVLVLLVIFMLTAHVMEFGMEVDVPKTKQVENTIQELPVVTITRDGNSYINEKEVNINLLGEEIAKRFKNAKSVYLRVDKAVTWDVLSQVVAALGEAKLGVNMVTEPVEDTGGRR